MVTSIRSRLSVIPFRRMIGVIVMVGRVPVRIRRRGCFAVRRRLRRGATLSRLMIRLRIIDVRVAASGLSLCGIGLALNGGTRAVIRRHSRVSSGSGGRSAIGPAVIITPICRRGGRRGGSRRIGPWFRSALRCTWTCLIISARGLRSGRFISPRRSRRVG